MPPASARPAVPGAADSRLLLARASLPYIRARRSDVSVIVTRPFNSPVCGSFAVCIPAGFNAMNKRKRNDDAGDRRTKRQRQKRSSSEPLACETSSSAKRVVLKRLFGRVCSVELENKDRVREEESPPEPVDESVEDENYTDENEDPLLDSVPENMDPEQLGFLVCAQETLRFLHRRGMSIQHPVFARLRLRFLRGLNEMGMA